MKYTILINQLAAQKSFPSLDIVDLAIFDYIKDFAPKAQALNDDKGQWFWISSQKIIDDMPVLGVKTKRSVQLRIKKLTDCNILERHPQTNALGRAYFRFGSNYMQLIEYKHNNDRCEKNDIPPKNISQGGTIDDIPPKNISHPCEKNFAPPAKNISQDYSINDKTIKDNNPPTPQKGEQEFIFFKKMFFEKFNSVYLVDEKETTKQLKAIEKLKKLRPDFENFLKACFNISDKWLLARISPAEILKNYNKYVASIANEKESPQNGYKYFTYEQILNFSQNVKNPFQKYCRVRRTDGVFYVDRETAKNLNLEVVEAGKS